jgi:hypothetical protein
MVHEVWHCQGFRPPQVVGMVVACSGVEGGAVIQFLLARTTVAVAKQQIVVYLETYRYVKPQLSGHDLHAMGLTPGPLFRKLLNGLAEAES